MTTNTDSQSPRNPSPRSASCLLEFAFVPLPSFSCSSHRYQRLASDANTWRTNNSSPTPCIWGWEFSFPLSPLILALLAFLFPFPHFLSSALSAWRGEHRLAGIIRPLIEQSGGQPSSPLHLPNPAPRLFSNSNRNRDRCRGITPQRLPQR
jgi:hypothetical protein